MNSNIHHVGSFVRRYLPRSVKVFLYRLLQGVFNLIPEGVLSRLLGSRYRQSEVTGIDSGNTSPQRAELASTNLRLFPAIQVYETFAEEGYYCVGYPSVLAIFLTTHCNLSCFICRREGFTGEHLRLENIYKLEKAVRFAKTVDLTGWGEPLIYPRFEEALEYIYSINPGEVIQFTTNGTKLSERHAGLLSGHLKFLVISLNAATESTYNRDMKHGYFTRTISSVMAFLSALADKDRQKINLHMVAHKGNFHEIPDFVRLAHNLHLTRVSIGHYLISIREHLPYGLLNFKTDYNAVVDQALGLGNKLGISVTARKFFSEQERPRSKCTSPFDEVFVKPNGDVGPCCFSGNYLMGNAYETSFEDVWFGNEYRKLREERHLDACRTCTPFIPFDSFNAHFTGDYKATEEFSDLEHHIETAEDSPSQKPGVLE